MIIKRQNEARPKIGSENTQVLHLFAQECLFPSLLHRCNISLSFPVASKKAIKIGKSTMTPEHCMIYPNCPDIIFKSLKEENTIQKFMSMLIQILYTYIRDAVK